VWARPPTRRPPTPAAVVSSSLGFLIGNADQKSVREHAPLLVSIAALIVSVAAFVRAGANAADDGGAGRQEAAQANASIPAHQTETSTVSPPPVTPAQSAETTGARADLSIQRADDATPVPPSSTNAGPNSCGDGRIELGKEGCDDGNRKSGDGCSADCRREASP
jgi:cysteine-rich repeat protein